MCLIREGRKEEEWGPKKEDMEPTAEEIEAEVAALDHADIIKELEYLRLKCVTALETPWKLGMETHEYTKMVLDCWVTPCLKALDVIRVSSSKAIVDEIKNVLDLIPYPKAEWPCAVDSCTCHLRILNALVAEKKGDAAVAMEAQIAKAEDARHAARDISIGAMNALYDAHFKKRIAVENMEAFKWEGGAILKSEWDAEQQKLSDAITMASAEVEQAKKAHLEAKEATNGPAAEFHRLIAMKASM